MSISFYATNPTDQRVSKIEIFPRRAPLADTTTIDGVYRNIIGTNAYGNVYDNNPQLPASITIDGYTHIQGEHNVNATFANVQNAYYTGQLQAMLINKHLVITTY